MTEDLEIHIIEIPKIYKEKEDEKNKKLIQWLNFLENPESKEVEEYMKENVNVKEAKYTGYMEGLEEGRRDGLELGKEEGRKEGRKKVEKKARKLLRRN